MKPISRTAFYCTGVRIMDAEPPHPVCGDQYARRFMTPEALQLFEPFRDQTYPNSSNVARHRITDDLLRGTTARHGRCEPAAANRHRFRVDLMTRTFFRRYARELQERLKGLGAEMVPTEGRPDGPFLARGYQLVQRISIPGRAAELGAIRLPRILQWTLLRSLVKGCQIHVFATGAPGGT